jgi:hypothetical protein
MYLSSESDEDDVMQRPQKKEDRTQISKARLKLFSKAALSLGTRQFDSYWWDHGK